ncbi:MAG: hypothetical protein VX265_03585, partial [Myxococcota bacterium]|nr:hypothetical protein [Myxococcota bacterium]
MRRLFPLSTAAGLGLTAAGCSAVKADVDIVDENGDGIDDALQGGRDGEGSVPGQPEEGAGAEPEESEEESEVDPDATLQGDWALVELEGEDTEYTYRGENCTYTQSFTLFLAVDEGDDGAYRGDMILDYEWSAAGDDCPYDGATYTGSERYGMRADAMGDRDYEIRVR